MLIGISQTALRESLLHQLERQERTKRNFSLRRFAKQSGISHSLLSLIVSGKRPITAKSWQKMEHALPGLNPKATNDGRALPEFEELSPTDFSQISDWYYYAILSLLETRDFRLDYQWIAERLGITSLQAVSAISRLKAMGFIHKKGAKWVQAKGPLKIENTKPLVSGRNQQHQLLEKAIQSLEEDPFEVRDFSSMTLAMHPKQVPLARMRIRDFRRALVNELEKDGTPEEVYNLTVQIFPVSKAIRQRKKES